MDKELLISWLNDAYAMEQAQLKMLKHFQKDFESDEMITQKLEEHYAETEVQAEDIKSSIEQLGGKTSAVKSVLGGLIGTMQGISTAPYKDELVKDIILIHAGEHFEHATYLALVAAATACGEDGIAEICTRIASEEKAVADWAEDILPRVVNQCIAAREEKEAEDAA